MKLCPDQDLLERLLNNRLDETEILEHDFAQTTGFHPGSYSRCQKAIAVSSSRT